MADQSIQSTLRADSVKAPLPVSDPVINGESLSKNIFSYTDSHKDINVLEESNSNGFASKESLRDGTSDSSAEKVTDETMREDLFTTNTGVMPDVTISQTKETLGVAVSQTSEMPDVEKNEMKNHLMDNVTLVGESEFNGVITVQSAREQEYAKYKLDDKFESAMDRKSSAESGFEEQGNFSNTDSLEKRHNHTKDESSVSDLSEFESNGAKDIMTLSYSSAVSSTGSPVSSPSEFLSDMSVSTLLQQEMEPLIDEDSSISCSFGNSLSGSSSGDQTPDLILERSLSDSGMSPVHFEEASRSLPSSKSIEKITSIHKPAKEQNMVRASKSHENYLHNQDFQFVAIDIDDIAYSLDQIPQNPTPTFQEAFDSSFSTISQQNSEQQELLNGSVSQTDSLDLLTDLNEKQVLDSKEDTEECFDLDEKELNETVSHENHPDQDKVTVQPDKVIDILPKPCDTDIKESNVNTESFKKCCEDTITYDNAALDKSNQSAVLETSEVANTSVEVQSNKLGELKTEKESHIIVDSETSDLSDELDDTTGEVLETEFGPDGFFYQPPVKQIDQPSAQRLAKRLYNLDGFQKSDVSRHLSKKNDFSNTVAEEYLKLFNFTGDTLDVALRKFLKQFSLIGETQERERVLAHFSHQYIQNNPNTFDSQDACHTLVCAIMLLNTDLHGQTVGRKMTCSEFIENLSELNDGVNFHKDILKAIYHAIKTEPIEWAPDDDFISDDQRQDQTQQPVVNTPSFVGRNPFLDIPDPSQATEYKRGYIMRKCCLEPDGRKTPLGKRSWKMYFVVLRDMVLYLHKDEHEMKKKGLAEGSHNVILVHHSLATKATDYSKKQHVFRLQTADWAVYLFQTSNSKELQDWIDTVNFVAASLSASPLPGAVGSQKKFQRPLLPVSYTRFNLQDQLNHLQERLSQTEEDLKEHQTYPPVKGSKSSLIQHFLEKESYLEFEIKRLQTYIHLIQAKLKSHPELKPTLVETSIGENEEFPKALKPLDGKKKSPVQRSISDRGPRIFAVDMNYESGHAHAEHINEHTQVTYL